MLVVRGRVSPPPFRHTAGESAAGAGWPPVSRGGSLAGVTPAAAGAGPRLRPTGARWGVQARAEVELVALPGVPSVVGAGIHYPGMPLVMV